MDNFLRIDEVACSIHYVSLSSIFLLPEFCKCLFACLAYNSFSMVITIATLSPAQSHNGLVTEIPNFTAI